MNVVRIPFSPAAIVPVLVSVSMLVGGCSSVNQLLGKEESIDYKSASANQTTRNRLEVPPDLTQLPNDARFQAPAASSAAAAGPSAAASTTFSSYSAAKPAPAQPAVGQSNVLPERPNMRVERDGTQRWVVIDNQTPEQLYPVVRQFWQDNGFLIRQDSPQTGVMETDWAENRAKIPQDFLRRTIGKVLDSMWSTGERDMFRTRLERTSDGKGTEIYISHRGAVEELTGAEKSQAVWTSRPNDPGLEAEFLRRLMVRLGDGDDKAKTAVTNAAPAIPASQAPQLVSNDGGSLLINESFDRAWRRVGLALDRGGFTVEDRNRADGVYYVRYVDVDAASADSGKPGFFGRLFGKSDKPEDRPAYRVKLANDADRTRVSVLNSQGAPENSPTGRRILTVLSNQLK